MSGAARAQAPDAATPAPQTPEDALGRSTPRGTVLGFLSAGRRDENALARQYLNSQLRGQPAEELAHQLFVVLDARLPPRLTQVSDVAEGSRENPLAPDEELVGTIASPAGAVDIVVQRVTRSGSAPLWLFSRASLDAVPRLYSEVTENSVTRALPRTLVDSRLAGVRLVEWLVVIIALPLFYLAIVVLNRLLAPVIGVLRRRMFRLTGDTTRNVLPLPARLLLLALTSRWLLSGLPLSLIIRQFLASVAGLIAIGATVWLVLLLNGEIERNIRRRFASANVPAAASLLRVGRRVADLVTVVVAALVTLRRFGVDLTPVLAGLGVGGIAVALAAQKTLENVIAGASLIFDQALHVGDFLKVGEIQGTVDHIGLRSTRIRTLDRTVVSVPNSQIANMSLETLSARDKFWFHPVIALRQETTGMQLRAVVDGIRRLLAEHPSVDVETVRVRFLRFGVFSLDVDVFAYVQARDWSHFLEIQEQLLFGVTDVVAAAGTQIAFPLASGQANKYEIASK
jgi:MscS family membrane protein